MINDEIKTIKIKSDIDELEEDLDNIEFVIARDSAYFNYYPPESRSISRAILYDRALENVGNIYSDSLFESYVSSLSNSSVEILRRFNSGYLSSLELNAVMLDQLFFLDSLTREKLDSIILLDELFFIDNDTTILNLKSQVLNKLEFLNVSIASILLPQEQIFRDSLNYLRTLNNSFYSSELPYQKQQEVNEIFAVYRSGNKQVLYENYQQLNQLAHECPYQFGPAVYGARALLSLIKDSIIYEDYLSCLPYGFFRHGIQTQFESIPKLELKPNPTKESVTITLLNSNGGIHKIAVFDLSGKVVLVENLQNNLSSHLLDVENLVDGIYTLKISDIESVYVAKLIVIK